MEASDKKSNGRQKFELGNKYSKGRPKGSKNREKSLTKEDLLITMKKVYEDAIGNKKLDIALKAVALQAKILGMLPTKKSPNITRLDDWNQDKLREFIEILKKKSQSK